MDNSTVSDIKAEMPAEHQMLMEVFTDFHRITGEITTSAFRTNGVLNTGVASLLLASVITGSLVRPLDQPIESRFARINKNSIVIAVPNEEIVNDRLARRARISGYLLQRRVLLALGNFEVSGNLHLEQELELETVLLDRPELFIGVTDATIFYLPNPTLKFTANTVLINKNHVSFICAGAP